MKKVFQIMSLAMLMVVMCSSMVFAANRSKVIAVLPVQAVNCRYGVMTDEVMESLNAVVKERVDSGIGSFSTVSFADPEEAVSTFIRIYNEKKAVNKKATYRDAVALTARELKADLIVIPVAENCRFDRMGGDGGHNMTNYNMDMKVYVYNKVDGTTNTFKASDHFNGYDMDNKGFKAKAEICLSTALKRANLAQTVEMAVTTW